MSGFSLNVPPEENRLERVPVEELEAVLGKDTVRAAGQDTPLPQGGSQGGLDLLPWLLLALLLALASEALFANRSSRPPATGDQTAAVPTWVAKACAGALAGLVLGALVGAVLGAGWAFVSGSRAFLLDQATRFALVSGLVGTFLGAVAGTQKARRAGNVGPTRTASEWAEVNSLRTSDERGVLTP